MNHLQTYEAFGLPSKNREAIDLPQQRRQMNQRRREVMDKMAGIRQQISTAREQAPVGEYEPVVVKQGGREVDVEHEHEHEHEHELVGDVVAGLEAQLETLSRELHSLNALLG